MKTYTIQKLISTLASFSYFGIYLSTALSGYIIPLPEEVVLLTIGYLVSYKSLNIYMAVIFSILGILTGDTILFWLSHYKNIKIVNKMKIKVNKHKLMKYKKLIKNHIGKTIFLLRFIIALRFLGPFLAGSTRIRWNFFLLYDALAVFIYVPTIVFLGYYFHNNLAKIIAEFEIIRHIVFVVFLIFASYFVTFIFKNFKSSNKSSPKT